MDFGQKENRKPGEPFVPMINVVFLLLIFFLMTARIAPPEPFELDPPKAAEGGDPTAQTLLHLSADGEFAYREMRGEDAMRAAVSEGADGPVKLRVDGGMEASALATKLRAMTAGGAVSVELITAPR